MTVEDDLIVFLFIQYIKTQQLLALRYNPHNKTSTEKQCKFRADAVVTAFALFASKMFSPHYKKKLYL